MRVLWLVNVVVPEAGLLLNIDYSVFGGWIVGNIENIKEKIEDFYVATTSRAVSEVKECRIGNVHYIIFPNNNDRQMKENFVSFLKDNSFDIINIFGTEMKHSYILANISPKDKTVITIQGLTYYYGIHFLEGIAKEYQRESAIIDFVCKMNNYIEKSVMFNYRKFKMLGRKEKEIIENSYNFIGRTNWDRACIKQLNNNANYYYVNEILRPSFYESIKWNINKCERYRIFISQANYPIKGFHFFLKALSIVKKEFPNVSVYISGNCYISKKRKKTLILSRLFNGYFGYLNTLIHKYDLFDNIHLLGVLDEKQMVNEYLKANVFVCSSSIENSPNSVGEAMMIGTPVVASYVGGIPDMIEDNLNGLLYQSSAYYMLADKIMLIFRDDKLANRLSINEIEKSCKIYDKQKNIKDLLETYKKIISK